eukprot:9088225-Heterocapsa_arctica.AAC.1
MRRRFSLKQQSQSSGHATGFHHNRGSEEESLQPVPFGRPTSLTRTASSPSTIPPARRWRRQASCSFSASSWDSL